MYKVKLNISGSWLDVDNADLTSASYVRSFVDNSIRVRDSIEGEITFIGDTYDRLRNAFKSGVYKVLIRIYKDTEFLIEQYLNTDGLYLEKSRVCTLSCEMKDRYNDIYKYIDSGVEKGGYLPSIGALAYVNSFIVTQLQMQDQLVEVDAIETEKWSFCELGDIYDVGEWSSDIYYTPANEIPVEDTDVRYFQGKASSYARLGFLNKYVCVKENIGKNPATSPDFWVEVNSRIMKMGSEQAVIKMTNSYYYEDYERWGQAGCSARTNVQCRMLSIDLKQILEDMLNDADPTINLPDDFLEGWEDFTSDGYRMLIYYLIESDRKYLKITDIIGMIESVWSVSWRLEGQDFYFRKWTDIQNEVGTTKYYDLTTVFSRDWSNEEFNYDVESKIYLESYDIGGIDYKYKDLEFWDISVSYDTGYEKKVDVKNADFEVDMGAVQRTNAEDSPVLLLVNSSNNIENIVGMEDGNTIYNGRISPWENVFYNYYDWMPFTKALIYPGSLSALYGVNATLGRKKTYKTEIKATLYKVGLIDFDYLVQTNYEDLGPRSLSINLDNGTATLNAVK